MQNQRGFVSAAVLIAIVLGLIVVGGGAYYVMHQSSTSPTQTYQGQTTTPPATTQATTNATSQTQNTSSASTIHITVDPIASMSVNPTFSGTATGVSKVLVGFVVSAPASYTGAKSHGSASVNVSNGHWTYTASVGFFEPGNYTIEVYPANESGQVSSNNFAARSTFVISTPPPLSVPGMSTFSNSGFGFSFWYPSNWQVQKETDLSNDFEVQAGQGGSVTAIWRVGKTYPGIAFRIEEIHSPSMTLSGPPYANVSSGNASLSTYSYNASTRTWKKDGSTITTSLTTLDGLPVVEVASTNFKGNFEGLIPLSGGDFIVVYDSPTTNTSAENFIKTISSTDASVSAAQQTAAIQAEAAAYSGI